MNIFEIFKYILLQYILKHELINCNRLKYLLIALNCKWNLVLFKLTFCCNVAMFFKDLIGQILEAFN